MEGAGDGHGGQTDKGDKLPPQDGTLKVKIDDAGKITGTIDNATLKQQGTVTGTVTDDGDISVTTSYKDQDSIRR